MVDADHPAPSRSIEREVVLGDARRARLRAGRLQAIVDEGAESLISGFVAHTLAEAAELRDVYDQGWFKRCLYSGDVRARVARALIAAVARHPMIDVDMWAKMADGSDA